MALSRPEFRAYWSMLDRCYKKTGKYYNYYGGRGIIVCDKWLKSKLNFLEDMGERPQGTSLDRIDPDGNYEPGNVRWATWEQQMINRRIPITNTSGYRGVYLNKITGKWIPSIHTIKNYVFGYYGTAEEAAYVRDQVAIQIHGKDAKLNLL